MSAALPGREPVLGVLDEVLDSAASGAARCVVVHGEPGSGRSAVLDAAERAAAGRFLVLRASGHPAESELPYAGLHQLLQPLLREFPDEGLPPRLAHAFGLPGSRQQGGGTALGQELLMLVAAASERRPVLILVDDAQWLDDSSRTMLVFLARRLDDDAVAVVVATEAGPPAPWTGVGGELVLAPLDRTAARALLRAHHPELSGVTVDWLHHQAGGVPLLLLEAADRLTPDQRTGREPLPAVLTGESRVAGPQAERLTALPSETLEALLLVALDDLDDLELVRALARRGLGLDHLDPAERAGLVRLDGGRCRFTSASARWWVRTQSTDADRRLAHQALADALTNPGTGGRASTVIRRALHLHEASLGPDREVAAALAEAADEAGRRGGFTEAGRLWHLAADRAVTAAEIREARIGAVEHYFRGGMGEPALVLLDALVDEAVDETEQAQWHTMRVLLNSWCEVDLVAEHEQLARLAGRLLHAGPEAGAAGARLVTAMSLTHLAAGRCWAARQALDLLGPVEALTGLPRVLAASLGAEAGHTEPAAGLIRAWLAELENGDLDEATVSSIGLLADVQWPDAVQVCELMWQRCEELIGPTTPQPLATILVRYLRARLDQARGDWDAAIRELAEVGTLALDAGFDTAYPFITLRRAMLLARRGDVAASVGLRRAVLTRGNRSLGVNHLAACVEAAEQLATGEYAGALTALDRAAELERRGGWTVVGEGTRTAEEVELLCRLGRLDEATRAASAYATRASRSAHPTDLALAGRCLGLVAPVDEMDKHFEDALGQLRDLRRPFEVARTLFTWGQRLRRARRKADALPRLDEADQIFAGLGAHGWRTAVEAELAACGRRHSVEAPPDSVLRDLTPREFAVVREVAGGATNAEAAARLFISPRTVEQHLSRAYRKLGVPHRTALVQLIEALEGADDAGPRQADLHAPEPPSHVW